MTVTRKPLPSVETGAGVPPPLPYPTSPSSPRAPFAFDPQHAPHERQSPSASTPPRPQFLDRPVIPHSHNSSVSDLSDGWVDTRRNEEPFVSRTDLDTSHEPAIPRPLQLGTPGQLGHAATSSPGLLGPDGLDALDRPQIPAPLRVTPPASRSNNPFHRSPSAESQRSNERRDGSFDRDNWMDLPAAPRIESTSATARQGSPSHAATLGLLDPSKQYRAYSPSPAERPFHQTSASMPTFTSQESVPNDERVELPSSPTHQVGHAHSVSEDVYSSLAELDINRPQPARPPIPMNQPPLEPALSGSTTANMMGAVPQPLKPEMTGTNLPMSVEAEARQQMDAEQQPRSDWMAEEKAPVMTSGIADADKETPMMRASRQRGETYEVKKIRWIDSVSPELRSTPIMVQNANGPCPLLALVNALTLSTPANVETALVEALRSREQVTLGLLLDAVFDELMSGRRGNAAQELPDVGELYSFLLALHTGMNVNPQFVPPKKEVDLMDGFDTPRSHSYDGQRPPGGFEDTREMKLYSTFAVPLMHGWLPPRTHPAYAALQRSATTYEDAQNVLFREDELEEKLTRQGLNAEEQQLLEDIATVKYFLQSSATQLTSYGLDVVTDAMTPGSIAILFRNDHFSTLYKHPRSGQLLQLVTDMGYAGHDEVVWESLVDVSGEGCEFYSGDFRPVGMGSPRPLASPVSPVNESGWTTVQHGHRPSAGSAVAGPSSGAPGQEDEYNLPSARNTEQEDADLALAMQLQEEEEEDHRQAAAQRQREEDASQAFLAQQQAPPAGDRSSSRAANQPSASSPLPSPSNARDPNPSPNSRRVGNVSSPPPLAANNPTPATRRPSNARPAVHREAAAGEDAPPPTYEQAARATPYHGPVSSSDSGARPAATYAQMRASNAPHRDPYTRERATSAYSQHRSANMPSQQPPPNPGTTRRRASGAAGILLEENAGRPGKEREREKDCVVM